MASLPQAQLFQVTGGLPATPSLPFLATFHGSPVFTLKSFKYLSRPLALSHPRPGTLCCLPSHWHLPALRPHSSLRVPQGSFPDGTKARPDAPSPAPKALNSQWNHSPPPPPDCEPLEDRSTAASFIHSAHQGCVTGRPLCPQRTCLAHGLGDIQQVCQASRGLGPGLRLPSIKWRPMPLPIKSSFGSRL